MSEEPTRGALLIADDEEFVRAGLAELLRRAGFECTVAATGAEALACLQKEAFDAMISDIHMPGNVELETVATVRRVAPALPIVLLTGRPSVETAARAVRLPVTAYLTKPPNMDELISLLDGAIADYRGYQALSAGRARLRAWDEELAAAERRLRAVPAGETSEAGSVIGNYLRLTVRQLILILLDLERASHALDRTGGLAAVNYEAALRHTIEVLERTKQNFKSKDLAELRRELEKLLQSPSEKR